MNANANIVDTLVASFMYEPGIVDATKSTLDLLSDNEKEGMESVEERYVHEPPADYVFPTYLKSFDVRSGGEQDDIQHNGPPLYKCESFNKRGLTPHGNPRRLNDSWLAWSFQANFMYAPVL